MTVIEPLELPLLRVLGPELGAFYRDVHAGHGVELLLGTGVEAIEGSGRAERVRTSGGGTIDCDAVVMGVGVAPDIALAEGVLDVDNGILVDAALRTSADGVFAAGDVANHDHPVLRERIRVEHWANALEQGPVAARAMLGQDVVYDKVPYFFSDQYDVGMEYAGNARPDDEVVFRGIGRAASSSPSGCATGACAAGMNVNVWDVNEHIQELVSLRRRGRPQAPDRHRRGAGRGRRVGRDAAGCAVATRPGGSEVDPAARGRPRPAPPWRGRATDGARATARHPIGTPLSSRSPCPATGPTSSSPATARASPLPAQEEPEKRRGFFRRLRENLSKTRQALGAEIQATLFAGELDAETWERLEEALIMADVGAHDDRRGRRAPGDGGRRGRPRGRRGAVAAARPSCSPTSRARRTATVADRPHPRADRDHGRGRQRDGQDDHDRQARLAPAAGARPVGRARRRRHLPRRRRRAARPAGRSARAARSSPGPRARTPARSPSTPSPGARARRRRGRSSTPPAACTPRSI